MEADDKKIEDLLKKLESLVQSNNNLQSQIDDLKGEISKLTPLQKPETLKSSPQPEKVEATLKKEIDQDSKKDLNLEEKIKHFGEKPKERPSFLKKKSIKRPVINLEKFIGENLINKIGILITVIGVGIGVKYAIDNQLISPVTRIVLGYLLGLGLIGFSIYLKKNYEAFSAVLLSGAMAINYIISFAAFDFYSLIPQSVAFALMVLFTIFTVVAALYYNNQIIALIGLVGAYAAPFLLGDEHGNANVLFGYTAIINAGILFISFKKNWKPVYYVAFVITWMIFGYWKSQVNINNQAIETALGFSAIFFIIFYSVFVSYKLLRNEQFNIYDIGVILVNALIFYGIGYDYLDNNESYNQYIGLFTILNAFLHFIVAVLFYRKKLADKAAFLFVSGLVLSFLTLTIVVQLDGIWVTVIWAFEALLLYWISQKYDLAFYRYASYILMGLAASALAHDYFEISNYYSVNTDERLTPVLNGRFLGSIIFVMVFAGILYLMQKSKQILSEKRMTLDSSMKIVVFILFTFVLYVSFMTEIATYWQNLYSDSFKTISNFDGTTTKIQNYSLMRFGFVWVNNYTLLFLSLLSFINIKKLKIVWLAKLNFIINCLMLLSIVFVALFHLDSILTDYITQSYSEYYDKGISYVLIRYISMLFWALLFYTTYLYSRQSFFESNGKYIFIIVSQICFVAIVSTELFTWSYLLELPILRKLGLTIVWGLYALSVVVYGIWKKEKAFRIIGFIIFALALIKLFFFDVSNQSTLNKTIIFICLGIILLIVSFLYNKYKNSLFEDEE